MKTKELTFGGGPISFEIYFKILETPAPNLMLEFSTSSNDYVAIYLDTDDPLIIVEIEDVFLI